jgi:hypothetical protein
VARADALVLGHGAARDLEQPRGEPLFLSKPREPALDAEPDVLQDIIDVRRGDPPGKERLHADIVI